VPLASISANTIPTVRWLRCPSGFAVAIIAFLGRGQISRTPVRHRLPTAFATHRFAGANCLVDRPIP
jgi:hypothetical protein